MSKKEIGIMRQAYGLLLVLTFSSILQGQTPGALTSVVGDATADRAVDSGKSTIELQASTDDSNATVKASKARPIFTAADRSRVVFESWSLAASAPLSKGGDGTTLVSHSGFPDAFTLTGKYSRYLFAGRRLPDFTNPSVVMRRDAICAAVIAGAMQQGLTEEDAKKLECDSGNVAKFAPDRMDDHNALFFEPNRSQRLWGGTATVGHREFKYLTAEVAEQTSTKTPWGVSVFVATVPRKMTTLFTGGLEYRNKYKDADAKTLCPQDGSATALECKTGPAGAPVDADEQLAYLEVRRLIRSRAFSLKVAYDFEKEQFGLDLPIYLVPDSDAGLAGGIRIAWVETEGAQVGVFVNSAFTLFP